MIPSIYQPVADPMETVRVIQEIGPERCVIASDFGQVLHVNSVDGVRIFVRALLGFGVKPADVRTMIRDNPAKLMWLD
jgi:predicted metal-dependent TIM-barrel fold hydrolase